MVIATAILSRFLMTINIKGKEERKMGKEGRFREFRVLTIFYFRGIFHSAGDGRFEPNMKRIHCRKVLFSI